MFVAAALSAIVAFVPQTPTAPVEGQPVLSAREQASLADKLRKMVDADSTYDFADGSKNRAKARKDLDKAKDAFEGEWDRLNKKGDLMKSMVDLREVFDNCFTHKRPNHSVGQVRLGEEKERDLTYAFWLPKGYKPEVKHVTFLVMPGTSGSPGEWIDAREYFTAVWDKSELAATAIFHLAQLPKGLEMDPVPDYSREGADREEGRRIESVFAPFGTILGSYNVDRGRVFLDCARENCGFGVRFATLFPDRFAGVILRDPVPVEDIRLGSLKGVPFLLLKTQENAAAVEKLQKRLEEVTPGKVTVLEAKGAYPHAESAADIQQWTADKHRNMSPTEVVIEPNHDSFNRAFWVDIITADALLTTTPDKRPRIEVVADRSANRITVKSVGVERFELLLNDDLVDLDKEFTVVINEKAVTEQRQRSFGEMYRRVRVRGDWEFLFPVQFVSTVARE